MPKGYRKRSFDGKLIPSNSKGRMPFTLSSVIRLETLSTGKQVEIIHWTCPHCGYRNAQRWFGRERHVCLKCDEWTDLKGATVTNASISQMEVQ